MILLCGVILLSGCGVPDLLNKPQEAAAVPENTPMPAEEQPAADEPQSDAPEQAEITVPDGRTLIHIERAAKDAFDPAEGTARILNYVWDSVRVESEQNPAAAAAITEEMAVQQDLWYTGTGESEVDQYGYNTMLEAAEDIFTIAREYGGDPIECFATRFVTVLRATEEVCAFLITTSTDPAVAQKSLDCRVLCFDMQTGAELPFESSAADEEGLRADVDARFPIESADGTAAVRILPLEESPEEGIEIVDQVVIGDGGEACLLMFDGAAQDVEICSVRFSDRFIADQQLFFCNELRDCALQLALIFPGDLPNTMLRYRDSTGEHEYLISMSGLDGSIILSRNTFSTVSG